MGLNLQDLKYTIPWNLFLLTAGSLIFVIGMNGVVIHQNFIPGGLYGLVLFIHYETGIFSTGVWFLLLNIPLTILGSQYSITQYNATQHNTV